MDLFKSQFWEQFWEASETRALMEPHKKKLDECWEKNFDSDDVEEDCSEIYIQELKESKEFQLLNESNKKELDNHSSEYSQTLIKEYQASLKEYYGPEKTKERERFAEKICNAQGIY